MLESVCELVSSNSFRRMRVKSLELDMLWSRRRRLLPVLFTLLGSITDALNIDRSQPPQSEVTVTDEDENFVISADLQ